MIQTFVIFIQTHLLPLGGLGVFAASVIEEIVAPIPSALVIFTSGFLLVSGPVSPHSLLVLFFKVAVPAAFGIVVGSLFAYWIAYYAGKPALDKWGKWFGFSWSDVEKIQQKFATTSFDEWSLFVVRALPIIPSIAINVFCGLVRFPLRSYLLYSLAGLIVRTTILGFVGWQIGALYFHYAAVINLFENFILAGLGASVIIFIGWRLWRVHQAKKAAL